MFRATALTVLLLAFPVLAQPDPPIKDDKALITIVLHPTAAPVPLSRISFYPEYGDLTPGNRVQGLLKVFMEQDNFFRSVNSEEWQKWLQMPLAELPDDVRERASVASGIEYDTKYTRFLGYLDKGARYKTIEWNEYFDLRRDGFNLLLPEVQKMRTLAMVLKARLRGEIRNGEFKKAATSVKSLFGIGQAMEQHPTLIGALVGIAIDSITLTAIEEMLAQPGCHNLYWAISAIPQPLVSLRTGIGGERIFLLAQFDKYFSAERPWTEQETRELLEDLNTLMQYDAPRNEVLPKFFRSARMRYALLAADAPRIKAGRERLIQEGRSAEGVKAMTDLQIAILNDVHRYEVLRDEYMKAMLLPYPEAKKELKKAEELTKASRDRGDILGVLVLPAIWKVTEANVRTDQRVAYLRIIEAIRLYAHEHKGQLPAKLADLTVPVPLDPVTGKPFQYSVADGVATLTGENPLPGSALTNRVYKLSIKK